MTEAYSLIGLALMQSDGMEHADQVRSLTNNLSRHLDVLDSEQLMTVVNLLLPILAFKATQTPRELLQTLWEALPQDDEWTEEWIPMLQRKGGTTQN